MERQTLNIQTPIKDNIIYFNTDVDLCTVSDFNKTYIDKCREIIKDKTVAEESIHKIIQEYNIAWNPDKVCDYTFPDINLKTPSLYIMLTSPGGMVYAGLSMYDVIKSYNRIVNTNIYVSGMCMSMGTTILCSVPVEQRVAHPNTTFMIHQVSSLSFGCIADMEQDIEHSKQLNERLFDILKNNTNIPESKLEQVYKEKLDWFITADEAVQYGLISRVSEVPIVY